MAHISIGRTSLGKSILIDSSNWKDSTISEVFRDFTTHDNFDGLLAVQALYARELRRTPLDQIWLESLDAAESYFSSVVEKAAVLAFKKDLGIDSAFLARDYGLKILHKHFRLSGR